MLESKRHQHSTATQVKSKIPAGLMELVLVSVAHSRACASTGAGGGHLSSIGSQSPRIKDEAFLAALQQTQSR